jgi:hypothetical protein
MPAPKSNARMMIITMRKIIGSRIIINALNMLILWTLLKPTARRYKDQSEEMTPPNTGIRSKIAVLCE